MKLRCRDILIGVCIFWIIFIVFYNSIIYRANDSVWTIPVALSIIKESNVDLDEYKQSVFMTKTYTYETINGHVYNCYPIGTSIIALPFVFVLDKFLSRSFGFDLYRQLQNNVSGVEVLISSLIVALTGVLFYYITRIFLNIEYSAFLTFIFAFCTSSWSVVTRCLWQHGPSMLVLTVSLYLILLSKESPWLVQFTSIPLAFSYIIRPTNAIPIFILSIYIFLKFRKYFLSYFVVSSCIFYIFFLFNFSIYHSLTSPYYSLHRLSLHKHYLEALIGFLFSPGRGLFIFSPILLFSIYGFIIKIKSIKFDSLDFFLVSIIVLHWFAISATPCWWGGHFFGTRFFADMTPYFMYFLIFAVEDIFNTKNKMHLFLVSILILLTCFSFFIQYRGATSHIPVSWCWEPNNIDENHLRVWDWRDLSFLRY